MEMVVFCAIISIAVMCWLFCTFYFFGIIYEENDDIFSKLTMFIISIFVGWVFTPIFLAIKYSDF